MHNILALIEAMQRVARESDQREELMVSLIDAATSLGMTMNEIQNALASDRGLVIYEP